MLTLMRDVSAFTAHNLGIDGKYLKLNLAADSATGSSKQPPRRRQMMIEGCSWLSTATKLKAVSDHMGQPAAYPQPVSYIGCAE